MRTIKLTIAYDGSRYSGWQLQKNGHTVQKELERAIEKVTGRHTRVHGASRTDAGVHARGQVCHFPVRTNIPVGNIPGALNRLLPEDIAVVVAEEAKPGFHSRFDAKRKLYRYHIAMTPNRDPFSDKYSWRVPYKLNVALMKREASVLVGKHDFRSFQARDKKERASVRTIYRLDIMRVSGEIVVEIEGDGFLYNMVRNVVGTLVDLGRGYIPEGSMRRILDARDRAEAGPTAPARGLFLVRVDY